MTDGVGAGDSANIDEVKSRELSANAASKELGFQGGKCHDFNDNAMDTYPLIEVVKAVEKAKNEHKPTLVYTHSGAEIRDYPHSGSIEGINNLVKLEEIRWVVKWLKHLK